MPATPPLEFRPQPGPQSEWLASPADIAVYGGAAFGGKTFALLMEGMRHVDNPGFGAVIFRRTSPQITNQGGLWDTAGELYPLAGALPLAGSLEWRFPSGSTVGFRHLQHEANKYDWMGTQVPLVGFDELTHFCYNAVMETLAESGWKRIADVQLGERVLALTPDGIARYEDVTAAWSFDFEGEMHETTNRSVRYSVTPNHKMVIRRQGHQGWQFCEAKDLDRFPRYPFDSEWEGFEREWVDLPTPSGRGIGANQNSVPRIAADLYLELLGWYLAEGSAFLASKKRNASPCVSIRQTKACPELHDLMRRLPLRSRFIEGDGYRIFSKQLHDHFKPLGNLYQKRVPRWVMGLSRRQLRIAFDAFTLGDGQRITNGAIAFGLANEGLIDDFQEIAAKLGHRATKAIGKGGKGNAYTVHRLYVHARAGGLVHDRPENKRTVPYKGKVHCLTVEPSHTLLVRHEGRVSWSGNSESQFWYMISRNRSTCGVRPYVRATCNPDPGWVKKLLGPWVDRKHPLHPTPSGELLWFLRVNGEMVWGRSAGELADAHPGQHPKSITFVRSTIWDNRIGMAKDPDYLGNLQAQNTVERARLLDGDWDVVNEGLVYPGFGSCVVEAEDWPAAIDGRRYGGIDWGWNNPFGALEGVLDGDDVLWVRWERWGSKITLTEHSKALPRGRPADDSDAIRWFADPAGADQIAEFRVAGHDVTPSVHRGQKPLEAGIALVSERIRTGRLKVKGTLGRLIDEAGKYRYEQQTEKPVDADNHLLAALRYLVVSLDRGRSIDDRSPLRSREEIEAERKAEQERRSAEWHDPNAAHWWPGEEQD